DGARPAGPPAEDARATLFLQFAGEGSETLAPAKGRQRRRSTGRAAQEATPAHGPPRAHTDLDACLGGESHVVLHPAAGGYFLIRNSVELTRLHRTSSSASWRLPTLPT